MAGLATACALTARGWQVTVFEKRGDLMEGGRATLLQPNGLAALERLGALGHVLERGHRIARAVFYGPEHRAVGGWDYGELRHPHPYAVEIRPPALRSALADRLAELGGDPPRLGCEVLGLARGEEATGVRHRDPGGREHETDAGFLVGADGPGSVVRAALGIGHRRVTAPDTFLLGTVDVDGDSDELAVHYGPGYADGVVAL